MLTSFSFRGHWASFRPPPKLHQVVKLQVEKHLFPGHPGQNLLMHIRLVLHSVQENLTSPWQSLAVNAEVGYDGIQL